jgi:hypothetical protein
VGSDWTGVWVWSDNEAWAVGEAGQTYHYLNGQWTLVPSPTLGDLTAVYGFGPNDVWAVGSWDQAIHWDGSSWTAFTNIVGGAGLYALWGASSDDVWAAGETYWGCTGCGGPTVHFYDGGWSTSQTGVNYGAGSYVNAIWGTSSTDVWFDDSGGSFYYWNGMALEPRGPWIPAQYGLWGSAPNSYWAGGRSGAILYWDGGSWSPVAYPGNIRALWGVSDQQMWAVGMATFPDAGTYWAGGSDLFFGNESTWTTQASPQSPSHTLVALHGSSASNIWAAGVAGTLLHYDGGTWAAMEPEQAVGPTGWLNDVWGTGPTNVWAVGGLAYPSNTALVYHWDGGVWSSSTLDAGALTAIHGTGPDDIWAIGLHDVLHYDGTGWSERSAGILGGSSLYSIWAVSPTEAWAITDYATLYHWTAGGGWSASYTIPNTGGWPSGPTAVWGTSATNVFAGAFYGVAHWDGTGWTLSDGGTYPKGAEHIWGSGPSDIYFDEGNTFIDHFDGAHWTRVTALTGAHPAGISGAGPNDVWVLDDLNHYTQPQIFHWDGAAWTVSTLPFEALGSVYAADPHVVWVVGENTDIVRRTH